MARGLYSEAVAAYNDALNALAGDQRGLAPVLVEMARSQLEAGNGDAALAALHRAHKLAPGASGTRAEVDQALLQSYRQLGRLPEFAEHLASKKLKGAEDHALLGGVFDELGDHAQALRALRRSLEQKPSQIETRRLIIQILSRQGAIEEALLAYRALVRVAPREPRFVIELSKLLMESGQRAEALRLLAETDRRFPRDARLKRALFAVYSHWNEGALATRVLEQLSRIDPSDASHVIALGEQQLQHGDEAAALATWRRLLSIGPDRAEAHAALGETYLDHDMPARALAEYEAAARLSPKNAAVLKGLAETLERLRRNSEAAARWFEVYQLCATERMLCREARRRVVRLWATLGELPSRITGFERAFGLTAHAAPTEKNTKRAAAPDLEAGRFLAEAYRAMAAGRRPGQGDPRYLDAAERVFSRLLELVPSDLESLEALERSRAQRGDLADALQVLERLLVADPARASSTLGRMIDHALSLYRDEEALGYAQRLLALRPSDGQAHARLGDLYRARQDAARAIESYEQALKLDPDALQVRLSLAELYVSVADLPKARAVLREVVHKSGEDELVRRAARSLLQISLGTQELLALEQILLPLVLGHPQRPVYRHVLCEVYEALAMPLVERATERNPEGEAAQKTLSALGARAIKPLLESLADADKVQQSRAVELLGALQNPYAATALLTFAEKPGDTLLRRRALLAAASLAPPDLAPRFSALTQAPERRLRDAAAFGLSRMSGPVASLHLRALLSSHSPSVRSHALLGLGRQADAAAQGELRAALTGDRSAMVRAAAALALGMSRDRMSLNAIAAMLESEQGQSAVAAAVALGALGDQGAVEALSEALFASDPQLRQAALWSLRWLTQPGATAPRVSGVPAPDETHSLRPWLAAFLTDAPPIRVSETIRTFADPLQNAARTALRGPREVARTALAFLAGRDPLLAAEPAAPAELALLLVPELVALTRHDDPQLRAQALTLLSDLQPAEATPALLVALDDDDARVQSASLEALGRAARVDSPAVHERLARIAIQDPRWWMRLRALRALAQQDEKSVPSLLTALRKDPYAYVREQAALSLGALRSPAAAPLLSQAAAQDPEPRVQKAAAQALAQIALPGSQSR